MLYGVGKLGAKAKSGAGAGAVAGVSGPEANSFEFDLSKAEPTNDFNSFLSGDARGVQFNADGTKLFFSGSNSTTLTEVSLSTGYDIRTASGSATTHTLTYGATGIKFADSGNKFYTIDFTATGANDAVVQYDLTTAYDFTTASYTRQFNVKTATSDDCDFGIGIEFKTDGTKMFVFDIIDDKWFEFSLSTAFDISTASFTDSFDTTSQDSQQNGLTFNTDGTKMYVVGMTNDKAYEYTLSTGFDVSTATYDNVSFQGTAQSLYVVHGMEFSYDGTNLYILDAKANPNTLGI